MYIHACSIHNDSDLILHFFYIHHIWPERFSEYPMPIISSRARMACALAHLHHQILHSRQGGKIDWCWTGVFGGWKRGGYVRYVRYAPPKNSRLELESQPIELRSKSSVHLQALWLWVPAIRFHGPKISGWFWSDGGTSRFSADPWAGASVSTRFCGNWFIGSSLERLSFFFFGGGENTCLHECKPVQPHEQILRCSTHPEGCHLSKTNLSENRGYVVVLRERNRGGIFNSFNWSCQYDHSVDGNPAPLGIPKTRQSI